MKKRAVRHIYDKIHSEIPDYRRKDHLLARIPVRSLLYGILFDSSAFSKEAFYINIFVQPLYVPAEHLVLTFGIRVPGVWAYKISNIDILSKRILAAIQDHALPFHQRFSTLELFYRNAESICSPKNIHLQQALVLTSIYLDKEREAQEHLDILRRLVNQSDPKIPWPRAVLDETQIFVSEAATDRKVVHAHLQEAEVATLKNLRLNDLSSVPPLDGAS